MITETTGIITLIPENIPEELKERPQWVCWRYEERDGKMTKVPYTPGTTWRASTTDPRSWGMFGFTLRTYSHDATYDGIGFVFSDDDPFCGIDLDDCRNPGADIGATIAPWAAQIINRIPEGYTEVSPSGTGIHIITKGTVRGGGMRKGPVEMYSRGRYFALTGRML
jgi:primase-polymerase (primpol)-like protein